MQPIMLLDHEIPISLDRLLVWVPGECRSVELLWQEVNLTLHDNLHNIMMVTCIILSLTSFSCSCTLFFLFSQYILLII